MKHKVSWCLCLLEILVLLVVTLCVVLKMKDNLSETTLEVLQVISRHGARTPYSGSYPDDPNTDFLSQGKGQLTKEGAIQMYEMGKLLRNRYGSFLENDHRKVLARSSYVARCIQSGQAMFASIYPTQWSSNTDENNENIINVMPPVPIHVAAPPCDSMLYPDKIIGMLDERETLFGQLLPKEFLQTLKKNISKMLGVEDVTNDNIFTYDDALTSEKFHSLILPSWFDSLFPNLQQLSRSFFYTFATNVTLAKATSGELLDEILDNLQTSRTTKGTQTEINTFFYFTHDLVVGCLLGLLNVPLDLPPSFGATLLVEKHRLNSTSIGVKFIYLDTPKSEPITLQIPGCNSQTNFCTVQELKDNVL